MYKFPLYSTISSCPYAKRLMIPFALGAVLVLASNTVHAKIPTIVTGNNFLPYTDESLFGGGLFTNAFSKIMANAKLKYKLEFLPWKRCEEGTHKRKYLATFPYMKTSERLEKFEYSEEVVSMRLRYFVKKKSKLKFTSKKDLSGKRLCRPLGYGIEGVTKKMIDSGILKHVAPPDMNTCFRLLNAGRTEIVLAGEIIGLSTIRSLFKNKEDDYRFLSVNLNVIPLHIMVSKGSKLGRNFLKLFNKSVKEMKEDGRLENIFRNYKNIN